MFLVPLFFSFTQLCSSYYITSAEAQFRIYLMDFNFDTLFSRTHL